MVIATALILTLGDRAVPTVAEAPGIKNNEARVAWLKELGWQVEDSPALIEELLIPDTFDESYTDYLALQSGQGFDLAQYCGKRVKRYTYTVLNYEGFDGGMQAALLVYRNKIIGGQLQAADGSIVLPLNREK
jgi:hypothetical protein